MNQHLILCRPQQKRASKKMTRRQVLNVYWLASWLILPRNDNQSLLSEPLFIINPTIVRLDWWTHILLVMSADPCCIVAYCPSLWFILLFLNGVYLVIIANAYFIVIIMGHMYYLAIRFSLVSYYWCSLSIVVVEYIVYHVPSFQILLCLLFFLTHNNWWKIQCWHNNEYLFLPNWLCSLFLTHSNYVKIQIGWVTGHRSGQKIAPQLVMAWVCNTRPFTEQRVSICRL